ncbi:hypothetical protein V6Z12_D07G091700 [Gossypium hirsutum]
MGSETLRTGKEPSTIVVEDKVTRWWWQRRGGSVRPQMAPC